MCNFLSVNVLKNGDVIASEYLETLAIELKGMPNDAINRIHNIINDKRDGDAFDFNGEVDTVRICVKGGSTGEERTSMSTPGAMRAAIDITQTILKHGFVITEDLQIAIAEIINRETAAPEMLDLLECVIDSFDADGGIMLFKMIPDIRALITEAKE